VKTIGRLPLIKRPAQLLCDTQKPPHRALPFPPLVISMAWRWAWESATPEWSLLFCWVQWRFFNSNRAKLYQPE
jgi:hypothetical protein